MKKSAAVLGILCLLLLSACRIQPPEGGGASAPTDPIQTAPPTQESLTPSPGEETTPPSQTVPAPTPTETPKALTAQELTDLTREWSESQAARFAGYEAFALSKAYWFADHLGGTEYVNFIAEDGQDGAIEFLANVDGALAPLDAAAQLLEQPAADLLVANRAQLLEGLEGHIAALAPEGITEAVALDRFHQAVGDTPALGEDMWYCVSAEKTGYILMTHGGVYRLQPMEAMIEYAETPEFGVRVAFDKAAEAYGWFYLAPLPVDTSSQLTEGEMVYHRVNYPGISAMIELRTYLKTLFSDELVDELLAKGVYREFDGVLYAAGVTGEGVVLPQGTGAVVRESDLRIVYRLDVDCVYELVGDKWVFTEFPVTM